MLLWKWYKFSVLMGMFRGLRFPSNLGSGCLCSTQTVSYDIKELKLQERYSALRALSIKLPSMIFALLYVSPLACFFFLRAQQFCSLNIVSNIQKSFAQVIP